MTLLLDKLGRSLTYLLALAATLITVGATFNIAWLARFLEFNTPMPVSAALCIVSLAGSVSVCQFNGGSLSRWFAIPAVLIGLESVARWIVHWNSPFVESSSALPLPVALSALLIGLVFFGAAAKAWDKTWTAVVGMTSAFVAIWSLVILIALAAGVDFSVGWEVINQVSTASAAALFLVGTAIQILVIGKSVRSGWRISWIAPPIAAFILSGTMLLRHAQIQSENQALTMTTLQACNSIRDHLESKFDLDLRNMEALTGQLPSTNGSQKEAVRKVARTVVDSLPEFRSIRWYVRNDLGQWTRREIEVSDGRVEVAVPTTYLYELDERIRKAHGPAVSSCFRIADSQNGFLIGCPISPDHHSLGILVAVIDLEPFVESIPPKLCHDYHIDIRNRNIIVFSNLLTPSGTESPSTESTLTLGQSRMRISVTPTPEVSRQTQSPIPSLILVVGIITAFLTTTALMMWERSSYYSRLEKESREFLEGLCETSLTASYVFNLSTLHFEYANCGTWSVLGISSDDFFNGGVLGLRHFLHPDDWNLFSSRMEALSKLPENEVYQFECRIRCASRDWHWILIRECVLKRDPDGTPRLILGSVQDITARKLSEDEVLRKKDELEKIFELAPIGMAITSPSGKWLRVNPALCDILGYRSEELLDRDFQSITHPDDIEAGIERIQQLLDGRCSNYRCEKRYVHKSGRVIWALLTVALAKNFEGQSLQLICQILDITEQKLHDLELRTISDGLAKANVELEKLSRVDALTGVFNRRHFDERLQVAASTSQRYGRPLSVIMFDIDFFKKFNDEFGHSIGDEVLRLVSQTSLENCRSTDIMARYGGEEFVILCTETTVQGAIRLAEKLRERIMEIHLPQRPITASFGIASVYEGDFSLESLMQRADTALYMAKELGRNCVCADPTSLFAKFAGPEDRSA